MKEIKLSKEKSLKTPWLRVSEAAAYCGISRSTFLRYADQLPHGGSSRTRIYHVKILDAWIANDLDIPFEPDKESTKSKPKFYGPGPDHTAASETLIHPKNGKTYKIEEKEDQ